MELATGAEIDRFRVDAKIRSSALATVHRVQNLDDGGLYALKVLYLDRPTLQDRILVEGRAQGAIETAVDGIRDHDRARLCDVLQPGGDVYAVTEDILTLKHNIAQMHADAQPDQRIFRQMILNLHCALNRFGCRLKCNQPAIAHALHKLAAMPGHGRPEKLHPQTT